MLSLRPINFLKSDELEEYGQNEIRSLCGHYEAKKTFTWKENEVEKEKNTLPLVALDETLEEWQLLKKTVLAEQYPRNSMQQSHCHLSCQRFPKSCNTCTTGVNFGSALLGVKWGFQSKTTF